MCIFCNIIDGKIPSNKILENDEFLAFHDINPKAPVHILAIPKTHYESFNDATPEVMAKMTAFMHEVTKKVGIDESGYRIITNIGEDGAQEVKHLHFHILGGAKLKWDHLSDSNSHDFI
jgi:histidine triad (HIT) family protein